MLSTGVNRLRRKHTNQRDKSDAVPARIVSSSFVGVQSRGPRIGLRRLTRLAFAIMIALQTVAAVAQLSTADHLAEPGFWPTQDQANRKSFAGPDSCARCHSAKTSTQKETPMAQ